jgi:hypothetical protein
MSILTCLWVRLSLNSATSSIMHFVCLLSLFMRCNLYILSQYYKKWCKLTWLHGQIIFWFYLIKYCHVLGVCVTYKTGFGFDDRIYWTLFTTCHNISQIAIFDWTLSTSDHTTLIHYSWSKSKSKSHCDWRSVSQSLLVSSPMWGSWSDIYYCLTVTVLFLWGALSDERTGVSFVTVIVCSCKSFVIR